jgi:hypothetical protein
VRVRRSNATAEAPAPARRLAPTRRRVFASAVHLLRVEGEPVAMFTLTWEPAFDTGLDVFPPARLAAYMSRLAVAPGHDALTGARCVRRAAAAEAGADVLRSEANPDLRASDALLRMHGFEPFGPVEVAGGLRGVRLQKQLGLQRWLRSVAEPRRRRGQRETRCHSSPERTVKDRKLRSSGARNDGGAARAFEQDVTAGMVGINVPIPVPMAYRSFGGWKASRFGDLHIHGPEGVHFYTRGKVVTRRWADPSHRGVNLGFPTSG